MKKGPYIKTANSSLDGSFRHVSENLSCRETKGANGNSTGRIRQVISFEKTGPGYKPAA